MRESSYFMESYDEYITEGRRKCKSKNKTAKSKKKKGRFSFLGAEDEACQKEGCKKVAEKCVESFTNINWR